MKRLSIILLLIVFFIVACQPNSGTFGENSVDEITDELKSEKEKNAELEEHIKALEEIIEHTHDEANEINRKIESLSTKNIWIRDGLWLVIKTPLLNEWGNVIGGDKSMGIWIGGRTGEPVIQLSDKLSSFIEVSPDGSKVIFNEEYDWEWPGTVFIYDIDKKEKKENVMPGVYGPDRQHSPAFMKWLDNRYFFVIVKFAYGTVTRGGNVYLYDTENDTYREFIIAADNNIEICYFNVYGDEFIVFNYVTFDDNAYVVETKHFMITYNEIYDLINNGKTYVAGR